MGRKREKGFEKRNTGPDARFVKLAEFEALQDVLTSLKKHYDETYTRHLDRISGSTHVEFHEHKNFTTAVLVVPSSPNYLGVTKRNNKDRRNRLLAEKLSLYRALENYIVITQYKTSIKDNLLRFPEGLHQPGMPALYPDDHVVRTHTN